MVKKCMMSNVGRLGQGSSKNILPYHVYNAFKFIFHQFEVDTPSNVIPDTKSEIFKRRLHGSAYATRWQVAKFAAQVSKVACTLRAMESTQLLHSTG
jgi:hypothetical protein